MDEAVHSLLENCAALVAAIELPPTIVGILSYG